MKIHEKYIKRCIELAKKGLGTTRPNPMVGCVIVYKGRIIGEGYTSPYGSDHAEVNAIGSIKNKKLLKESVLYVSLEPCSHYGKTPPCANLISEYAIPKVVIGVIDDNSLVSGKGIKHLQANGCQVTVGVLEVECREVNKRFFKFHTYKRPYIVLKWAETRDGFIDGIRFENSEKKPNWISNKYSQQFVHKWRSEEQSILVGTNTVIADNPKLDVRKWTGENPVRLVLDNSMRIPHDYHVFDGKAMTIIFTSSKSLFEEKENVQVEYIDYSKNVPGQICQVLFNNNIQSVIIEGGAQTLQSFISENLWDEARIFIGDTVFNKGISAPEIEGELVSMENIGSDVLKIIKPLI